MSVKEMAFDILNERKRSFVKYYLEFGNVPKVCSSMGINPTNGYKLLKDPQVMLVLELEKGSTVSQEIPTIESIVSETIEMHEMDKKELEVIKKELDNPDLDVKELRKRADKLQDRMEKRNKFVLDVRAKYGEELNEDTFELRKMPTEKLIAYIDGLYLSLKEFVKKKKWSDNEKMKQELKEWKLNAGY
jgi:hypothetical protein